MGKNRVIGKDNQLMWNIPSETKHYKDCLGDHLFIIGRKNFEGSKENINKDKALILTRNKDYKSDAKVFNEVQEAIKFAKSQGEDELFVLGGEQIYKLTMPIIDNLYLTIVNFEQEGDTYFPKHENYNWSVTQESYHNNENEISWHFQKLTKVPTSPTRI